MDIKLYNTLSRKKDVFKPESGKKVEMYNCGPTVYDYIHVGNMRAFLMADLLRRVLQLAGYNVIQIKNITDIGHLVGDADEGEDKVIQRARKEGKTPEQIAQMFTEAFLSDEEKLHILPAEKNPKATENIEAMIKMIKTVIWRNLSIVFPVSLP